MFGLQKFWHTIPQKDIDAEARQLIVDYGADAEVIAFGNANYAQWAKGNNSKRERAERVLKAVRERSEFLR